MKLLLLVVRLDAIRLILLERAVVEFVVLREGTERPVEEGGVEGEGPEEPVATREADATESVPEAEM